MPKKTKKEKIIANYRKKIRLLQSTSSPKANNTDIKLDNSKKSIEVSVPSKKNIVTSSFFKTDLKKSMVLIFFILALEFLLYFATIRQYLRLF